MIKQSLLPQVLVYDSSCVDTCTWTPPNCCSPHIWTHLGLWSLPSRAKGHNALLLIWYLKWHLWDGDWSPFYFSGSSTPSKGTGVCRPDRVAAIPYEAFWKIRKRHPFGGTQLDKEKGNWISTPIYLLRGVLLCSAQPAQLHMVVEKNEDPVTEGGQAEVRWRSARNVMEWFLALDENLDKVIGVWRILARGR